MDRHCVSRFIYVYILVYIHIHNNLARKLKEKTVIFTSCIANTRRFGKDEDSNKAGES